MAYLDKGIENEKMAKLSYDNKCYNSCVNRYYYSFYQVLMKKMNDNNIKVERKTGESSHVNTFNSFKGYIKDVKKYKMRRVGDITSNFLELKKLRKKADYEEEMIEKAEADSVISAYNGLKRELEKF